MSKDKKIKNDLERIREIVFGEKEKKYDSDINQIQADLSSNYSSLEAKIKELESLFEQNFQDQKKQFTGLIDDVRVGFQEDMSRGDKLFQDNFSNFSTKLENKEENLKEMISSLKTELLEKIDLLVEKKVSKEDLVESFMEVCFKLSGNDSSSPATDFKLLNKSK